MATEPILITVKTYPTLSRKYGETVCTAGIRPDGSWVRLYPVPFRRLDEQQQYSKFDWVELQLVKSNRDPRPETYHPADPRAIQVTRHVGTADKWSERRRLVLQNTTVYDRLQPLLDGAKTNALSLAVFKPPRIHDFIWEQCERDWDSAKLAAMRSNAGQAELFAEDEWRRTFQLMPKLPYNFSYRLADADDRQSELQVLDWEAGQLFWNCMRSTGNDERAALAKVRQKYFDEFKGSDLHFFLGTMQQFHGFSPNPWVIIGVFPIPRQKQMNLL
jgi:hypothetical protein